MEGKKALKKEFQREKLQANGWVESMVALWVR
jgi:hypothetical protein